MKRKKFQQRWTQLVGTKELKEAGFDAPLFLRRGLLALAALTLILGIIFIAVPSYWGFWRKGNQSSTNDNERTLTFNLDNTTPKDWKGVTLILDGADQAVGTDTAKLVNTEINDLEQLTYFEVGDIQAGKSKQVTVNVVEDDPGRFTYKAVFQTRDKKIVYRAEPQVKEFN